MPYIKTCTVKDVVFIVPLYIVVACTKFIRSIFIQCYTSVQTNEDTRMSVDTLYRDGTGEISHDPLILYKCHKDHQQDQFLLLKKISK